MPLTPFHFGPGLFIGLIFIKYLDLVAFLIGNVILDVEPFLVVLYEQFCGFSLYPYHGFFHTIIGAILISFLAALILKKLEQPIKRMLTQCLNFEFAQNFIRPSSFNRLFFSVFSGTLLHLVFDSFTHQDVFPFWPSHYNPLLRLISYPQNHINCIILGILGLAIAIFYLKKQRL